MFLSPSALRICPLVEHQQGHEVKESVGSGALCIRKPWPGMARTVFGDHERFMNTYLRPYPGTQFSKCCRFVAFKNLVCQTEGLGPKQFELLYTRAVV